MIHELKTWPEYYDHLVSGRKTFELRRNDRAFREGDTLHLREYEPVNQRYTGREMHRVVTYMLATDMSGDFVVMALGQPSPDRALMTPINAAVVAYMAECMGMREPFDDQEQNFICGHMATFGHRLLESATSNPARIKASEEGTPIGSAPDPSSSLVRLITQQNDDDLTRRVDPAASGPTGSSRSQPADSSPPRIGNHYGAPLSVALEADALVIRIGVQTLAHAASYSDWAHDYEAETGDYLRTFAITDAPTFADDVRHAMLDEREDGSTPLSDFLDKMAQAAVEDGSPATDEARLKHGETDPRETWAKGMR